MSHETCPTTLAQPGPGGDVRTSKAYCAQRAYFQGIYPKEEQCSAQHQTQDSTRRSSGSHRSPSPSSSQCLQRSEGVRSAATSTERARTAVCGFTDSYTKTNRSKHRVAALYVDPQGIYAGLPDVEIWDETRDARLYAGPHPVVAHPPCNTWCQLASVNEARWGKCIGDDGGCFAAALAAVRQFGGVLEHPAYSLAWAHHDLPRPSRGVWSCSLFDPGYVTEVSQSAYGHPACKRTWLYFVGEPPALDWSDPEGWGVVGAGIHSGQSAGRPRVDGRIASATPLKFRDELLAMARACSLRLETV